MKKPTNKGFEALPKKVQDVILKRMEMGGLNAPVGYHMMPDGSMMSDEEMSGSGDGAMGNIMLYAKGGGKSAPGKVDRNLFKERLTAAPSGNNYITTVQPSSDKYQEANINAAMKNFGYKQFGQDTGGFPVYRSDAGDTFVRHSNKLDYVNLGDVSKIAAKVGLKAVTPSAIPKPLSSFVSPTNQLPVQFNPNQNFNPNTGIYSDPMTGKEVKPIMEQYKMGGGNLYKFVGDGYKKLGGSHAPQGESMDDFLTTKNTDFVNYIANNTKAALFKNDAMDLQKGFAELGQEVEGEPKVILDNPNNPLQPRGPQYPDFMQGPNGMYAQGNQNPQYVTDFTKQFNFPEVQSNTGTPSNLNLNPYGDVMNNSKPSYNFTTEDASDLTMFGIQGANNFFNRANEMEQEKQLKKKRTIENVVTPFYGSRGNYDINQGNFRPNDKTPISYKKGGQYQLNKEDISILLSQGYLLEFVD